ncbi:tRNA dimethylallyltransferase [Aliiroseovarius pelagivivens]|uniref:tRNA dimethylallyltransferase n=1 Tax=Aliiroseovarius pelagivivens TaxID=1639690 RepID=A0A2R8AK24_9RHOB|nr:tRNA (adenosine(37)-N6)-dimethylallyltransferase MiaA [Aliiroseovarius pelagivivens]SPF76366.1 tRNA dimethylallyltransferase [Aliiroseovarius pelagivivens]
MSNAQETITELARQVQDDQPVLIAGATASGKSALALAIAEASGGVIVNADALQVFENWRVVTARPSADDEARAPHLLYGHIPGDQDYSVGHWLRDVAPILTGPQRPIIVGGTGLNLTALTEGLADIPLTPPAIRKEGEARLSEAGLPALLADLDPDTLARIDKRNPARVARAWEVQRTTGRGLASWQDDTPPPLLPLSAARAFHLDAERDWLRDRIERRFDIMLQDGALDEAQRNLATWDPKAPSSKAIGAPELIAHLKGEITLEDAREAAIIASQQYAKRQRTWFRKRMRNWQVIPLGSDH